MPRVKRPVVKSAKTASDLLFGRKTKTGELVTKREVRQFVRREIIDKKLFEGCTVLYGIGYYVGVREPSAIVRIIHNATPEAFRRLHEIARAYIARHPQEEVFISDASINLRQVVGMMIAADVDSGRLCAYGIGGEWQTLFGGNDGNRVPCPICREEMTSDGSACGECRGVVETFKAILVHETQ
jgi:hypothetical protein